MKKLGCAKCGGAMKKMAKGGATKMKKMQSGGQANLTKTMAGYNANTSTMKMGGAKKYAKGGATKFGMLSVKAGIDKNPRPTAADRIAGAKKNARKTSKKR